MGGGNRSRRDIAAGIVSVAWLIDESGSAKLLEMKVGPADGRSERDDSVLSLGLGANLDICRDFRGNVTGLRKGGSHEMG